jgi:hypothetical protein
VVFGEILLGKAGGVELDAKKRPCERDPLRLLHGRQQEIMLSRLTGSPPDLILIMWSTVISSPVYPQ